MIDEKTIFEIHLLKDKGHSYRQISKILGIHPDTVGKYHKNPETVYNIRKPKQSKLDGYKDQIEQMLDEFPEVSAVVVLQRLKKNGFLGQITIVREYLRKIRGQKRGRQVFLRFESSPGEQMQVDWGHFGSLEYGKTKRKLYALSVVESFSRQLYVVFTHSQKQETLHQCLFNAFCYFGGSPRELVVDNMTTAVIERRGKVIRFNDAFLKFLRPFKITPRACNVRAAHEKGKIERSIGYIRKNFFPLRTFDNLDDIQRQVLDWLGTIANKRVHQTTGEIPEERMKKVLLRPLPFDRSQTYMETDTFKVHPDYAISFDSNYYTAPPWAVGKQLTVKADQHKIQLFHKTRLIASHTRCWEKKRRIENPRHTEEANKMMFKAETSEEIELFSSLGESFRAFLEGLVRSDQPVLKSVVRLLSLKDQYGTGSLSWAISKALKHGAFGADYIENILYQEMTPEHDHRPVQMKDEALNKIYLSEPNLAEYDAMILKKEKR